MDLDSAIQHCEEVMMENLEKTKDRNASDPIAINCGECAEEHHQLAEWLKELKAYKEQSGDAISRQEVLNSINAVCIYENEYNLTAKHIKDAVKQLPPVTPQPCENAISREKKTGRWILTMPRGAEEWSYKCSECNFWKYKKTINLSKFKYCPNCGAKMEVEE